MYSVYLIFAYRIDRALPALYYVHTCTLTSFVIKCHSLDAYGMDPRYFMIG